MQCCAAVRATFRKEQTPQLNGGERGGVWILLFTGVTLFEYNVSTILLAIVGYHIRVRELFSILRIKIIFPASCLHRLIPCSLYPAFLSGRDGYTSLSLVFSSTTNRSHCPLKRKRVLAKYHVADLRQIHWLEARSPWKGSFLVGSVNVVDCEQSLFCYENRWASLLYMKRSYEQRVVLAPVLAASPLAYSYIISRSLTDFRAKERFLGPEILEIER